MNSPLERRKVRLRDACADSAAWLYAASRRPAIRNLDHPIRSSISIIRRERGASPLPASPVRRRRNPAPAARYWMRSPSPNAAEVSASPSKLGSSEARSEATSAVRGRGVARATSTRPCRPNVSSPSTDW